MEGDIGNAIFEMNVEDHFDEPIKPEETDAIYHESINLNNTSYTEVYSNEYDDYRGLGGREKVYFHLEDGLIAVRDSKGVLWTRE